MPPNAMSIALYRSLLRVALQMPDDHRRALVVFRSRAEFDANRALADGGPEQAAGWTDAEVYRDNLEHQAAHLNALAARSTLVPIDLRRRRSASSHAETCSDPSHHHAPPQPFTGDRRKLIRAVAARKDGATKRPTPNAESKFMTGPEPSWLKRTASSG